MGICSDMKEVEGEGFKSIISLIKRDIPFIRIFAKNAFSCLYSMLQYTQVKQASPLQLGDTHCIHRVLQ